MNRENLIKLGAFSQKHFDMQDGFRVLDLPSDTPNKIKIPIIPIFGVGTPHEVSFPIEYEEIELQLIGIKPMDRIWAAYSKYGNTVVIKEAK